MLSILSINEISVNETQIQLSTLSAQYVANSVCKFFLPAHNATHVARALMNFYFYGDCALSCGLPGKDRAHDCHGDTSLTAKFTNALGIL